MKKGLFSTVLISVLLSGLTAFCVAKYAGAPAKVSEATTVSSSSTDGLPVRAVNLSLSDYPDFTFAAENAVKAVVFVKVTVKSKYQSIDDPFLQFFFGVPGNGGERVQQGSGSGVIIRSDGYIVTNNHVVANATSVEVTLNDDKTYEAKVIGTDPLTDVALLKIEANNLPTVEFADSDKLRLGEWVLAIGSPLGEELRSTITAGIVSAKGRSLLSRSEEDRSKIESFIQTDAAVNPGNSGGALVNKEGQLVGINTMIASTTGAYSGYSFAVPSNIVRKVVSDLIDFGSVKRVRLGVTIRAIDENIAKDLKLSSREGVYIDEVISGGSADKAGVKAKDIVLAIDSAVMKSPSMLQEKVNSFHPGDKAVLHILRDGKEISLTVTFQSESEVSATVSEDGTVMFYGAKLRAAEKGVEIVSAGTGKMARAGAEDGFIIRFVNDQRVKKPEEVIEIAKKSKRSVFIEGVTAVGRPGYFGFGKDE